MKLATAAGDQGLGDSRRQPVVAGGRLLKLRRRRRRKLSLFFSTNIYARHPRETFSLEVVRGLGGTSPPQTVESQLLFCAGIAYQCTAANWRATTGNTQLNQEFCSCGHTPPPWIICFLWPALPYPRGSTGSIEERPVIYDSRVNSKW